MVKGIETCEMRLGKLDLSSWLYATWNLRFDLRYDKGAGLQVTYVTYLAILWLTETQFAFFISGNQSVSFMQLFCHVAWTLLLETSVLRMRAALQFAHICPPSDSR